MDSSCFPCSPCVPPNLFVRRGGEVEKTTTRNVSKRTIPVYTRIEVFLDSSTLRLWLSCIQQQPASQQHYQLHASCSAKKKTPPFPCLPSHSPPSTCFSLLNLLARPKSSSLPPSLVLNLSRFYCCCWLFAFAALLSSFVLPPQSRDEIPLLASLAFFQNSKEQQRAKTRIGILGGRGGKQRS